MKPSLKIKLFKLQNKKKEIVLTDINKKTNCNDFKSSLIYWNKTYNKKKTDCVGTNVNQSQINKC